ncbi:hypothetical protein [Streptomyces rubiginosohelvolus]|uniref:hypothetical protein n=1 Tax=Streptomyces rubiginosohelvolus TaxID=67362 RepID=UPI0027E4C312|nr:MULTISPECIES: hypothetical protein [Streptomyces]
MAIGLGTHIQSLPDGWRVGITALAAIFPESEARIATALRELEQHGFLRRTRERVGGGKLATRTESCNHPEAAARRRARVAAAAPLPATAHVGAPVVAAAAAEPVRVPAPEPEPVRALVLEPESVRVPVPEPVPAPTPVPVEPVPGRTPTSPA